MFSSSICTVYGLTGIGDTTDLKRKVCGSGIQERSSEATDEKSDSENTTSKSFLFS